MDFSVNGEYNVKILATNFSPLFFSLPLSSRFNLHVYFRLFCQIINIETPSLIRKEKITCEKCGTQTTRDSFVRHKKSCSAGTLYSTHCPNFSTKSQNDLNYHIAKKHSAPKTDVTFKCKLSIKSFRDFMLYVNIETLNTECKSVQEQEIWMWNTY